MNIGGEKDVLFIETVLRQWKAESKKMYINLQFQIFFSISAQLNSKFVDSSPSPPGFHSLDGIIAGLKNNALNITRQSVFMLNRLQR